MTSDCISVFVRKQRINEDEGQHEASSARFHIFSGSMWSVRKENSRDVLVVCHFHALSHLARSYCVNIVC